MVYFRFNRNSIIPCLMSVCGRFPLTLVKRVRYSLLLDFAGSFGCDMPTFSLAGGHQSVFKRPFCGTYPIC